MDLATADDGNLSDFSNDLATDIGPLLALFGESMTCQYLSESTTRIDYFIFAMAPIGIITTIVSVIRVCGHSTLRAFIGRSQEGFGVVEAELCTSTSRDVCELLNKGGITRVLGKPHILELVHVPKSKEEIYIFKSYLERFSGKDYSEWEFDKSSLSSTISEQDKLVLRYFAPKPNLSLNVGIKKQEDWVFFAAAVVGLILQAGTLALAGVGVWILGWNLNDVGTSASRNYAPIMFIAGTIVMCAGMGGCAALIGQTTREIRYRRKRRSSVPRTRLLWLQPGPQDIGDQSFDPFVYFEGKNSDYLSVWTSSKKTFDKRFELYTFLAVAAVLSGYISQFIGLRGMKAWVSLTQLGITVTMSVIRGVLRMKRLDNDDNRVAKMPDLVAGHELDWLALEIYKEESRMKYLWCITGKHKKAVQTNEAVDARLSTKGSESQDSCHKLLSIRKRLANLTGHGSFHQLDKKEYQPWDDKYVKVRETARKLSAAICQAADSLSRKSLFRKENLSDIKLQIQAASLPAHSRPPNQQMISIALKAPRISTQMTWSIDSAQLEAVLGLCLWSLLSHESIISSDDDGNIISKAEGIEMLRIVSVTPANNVNRDIQADRFNELQLWLEKDAALSEIMLETDRESVCGLLDVWHRSRKSNENRQDWEKWSKVSSVNGVDQYPITKRQFCGWNLFHKATETHPKNPSTAVKQESFWVEYVPTNQTLLACCAQELYVTLLSSLAAIYPLNKPATIEIDGSVRLEHPTVTSLATQFVQNGLGSHADALSYIVPALGDYLRLGREDLLSALIKGTETYRKRGEWERAEFLMKWACAHFLVPLQKDNIPGDHENDKPSKDNPLDDVEKVFQATAEMYRWSLSERFNEERKKFALWGIKWMDEQYKSLPRKYPVIEKVLTTYQNIIKRVEKAPSIDTFKLQNSLIEAINASNKEETLYLLCFVNAGDFNSDPLKPALPLAVRNDWGEVISAIIEMGASIENEDNEKKTAVSYCAKHGREEYLRTFINLEAYLDHRDKDKHTPIMLAIESGHSSIVEMILLAERVDCNWDGEAEIPTAISWAAEHGNEVIIKQLFKYGADAKWTEPDKTSSEDDVGNEPIVLDSRPRKHINHQFEPGNLLYLSTKNKRNNITRIFLEWLAKADSKTQYKLLVNASRNQQAVVVQRLLQYVAEVETKNLNKGALLRVSIIENDHSIVGEMLNDNSTPIAEYIKDPDLLSTAVRLGHSEIVGLLLEYGFVATATDSLDSTPLRLAAEQGDLEITKLLIDKGAGFGATGDIWTSLLFATLYDQYKVVELLLFQISEDKDNRQRKTASGLASTIKSAREATKTVKNNATTITERNSQFLDRLNAKGVQNELVNLSVKENACLNVRNQQWLTPLMLAVEKGRGDIVRTLVRGGAKMKSNCIRAGSAEHEDIKKKLLQMGGDIQKVNDSGDTLSMIAERSGDQAIVQLLRELEIEQVLEERRRIEDSVARLKG